MARHSGPPADGADERALLDEQSDLLRAHRADRRRRIRIGLLLAAPVLVTFLLFAVMTTKVAEGGEDPGSVWFGAALYAAACVVAGRAGAVALETGLVHRLERVAVQRRRRDVVRDAADDDAGSAASGRDRLERALLDDLDDARTVRRTLRRQAAGLAATVVLGGAGAVAGLLRVATAPQHGTGWFAIAFGVTVGAAAGLLAVVTRRRFEAAAANLRRAERRHRELALYDVAPERLPVIAQVPVPTVRGSARTWWLVPPAVLVATWVVPVPSAPPPAPPAPLTLAATAVSGIPLDYPAGIVVSPDGRRAYVADQGPSDHPDDTVSVLDLATSRVAGTVRVAPGPVALALAPDGRRLYVAAAGSKDAPVTSLSVVDTTTSAVVATVALPAPPTAVAVDPGGHGVWVTTVDPATDGPDAVVLVDPATNAVAATVRVGHGPYGLAVAPDGRRCYVTNYGDNTVSVLDTATRAVTSTVPVGPGPVGVAVDPAGHTLWVAAQNAPDPRRGLTAVDTTSLAATDVDLGPVADGIGGAAEVALTPDGRRLLVARLVTSSGPHPSVDVVDTATRTVTGVVDVPGVVGLAAAPDGHHVYATAGDLWKIEIP